MAASAEPFKVAIATALAEASDPVQKIKEVTAEGIANETDRREAIETAFRVVLRSRLLDSNVDTSAITAVIDCAIAVAKAGLSGPTMPHSLLDDSFDLSTLAVCEDIFSFVESRLDAWSNEPFSGLAPRNVMLRLCNGLSARLSRTRDTVLSGRILLFLASVTPLQDKSGINMGSAFNTENVTTFDDEDEVAAAEAEAAAAAVAASEKEAIEAEAAIPAAEADKPTDAPVDYIFYRKFWTLQKYFTAPTLCYTTAGWSEFQLALKAVMTSFSVNKLDVVGDDHVTEPVDSDAMESEGSTDAVSDHVYFPKFLTSSKLFHLQQADSGCRRQILVQLLVLFQYLTGDVRFKKDTYKLTKAQLQFVGKQQANAYIYLKNTPPFGARFADSVRKVLEGELTWVKWKNESCPDYFRAPVELRKRKADDGGNAVAKKQATGQLDLGSAELTRLWNLTETNVAGCESAVESGRSIPEVETYFKNAIEEVAGEYPLDKRFWTFTEPLFYWRGLRLLGKDRLHYFQDFTNHKQFDDYMKHVLERLAAENKDAAMDVEKPSDAEVENGKTECDS